MVFPPTMTGYGSASKSRNGASVSTRSRMSRVIRIRDLSVIWPEMRMFGSPKRSANAASRTKLEADAVLAVVARERVARTLRARSSNSFCFAPTMM